MRDGSTVPDIVLPSEERAREIEAGLMFGRRAIWTIYAAAGAFGAIVAIHALLNRSALLAPINPNFHAAMIGLGVFIGVILAAVEHDGWKLGIGRVQGGIPKGPFALLCMAAMVLLCGVGGSFLAKQAVEWQAFHGLEPASVETMFTVTGKYAGRSSRSLDLEESPNGYQISIECPRYLYYAVHRGDRLFLPVQTGRGGVRRLLLPSNRVITPVS